jgi:hypothetical protein
MSRNADRRIRSGPALAILFLMGLLIGYPLSAGPVSFLYRVSGEPSFVEPALEAIYGPLGALPKPILGVLENWVDFWDGLTP